MIFFSPIPRTLLPPTISLLDSTLYEAFSFSLLDISSFFCLLYRHLNYNFINIFFFLLYFCYITQGAIILVNAIFYGALIIIYDQYLSIYLALHVGMPRNKSRSLNQACLFISIQNKAHEISFL